MLFRIILVVTDTNRLSKDYYGGCFEMLLYVVLALATTGQSAKRRVVGLSSCRPVANHVRQTARSCGVLSRSHIVARLKSKDLAYKRQDDKMTARQRTVWRLVVLSLAITRCNDDIGCVVGIDATRNVPNQPP
jgi:hypothetical protein